MLNTPILLITFNRPSHTARVLATIMAAQPRELYVFQDGARENNDNDIQKCAEVRQVVQQLTQGTQVQLHTNYSNRNLGCGAGPMSGITWFFSQVARGIVMEDDCLPHPDFFGYCEELLTRYEQNDNVRFISSTLYNKRWQCKASYDFSHYMVTGAWAGWRRTWQSFDLDLKTLNARKFRRHVLKLTGNRAEANWWYSIVKEIKQDDSKKSYWDYQMQIHLFRNEALTIHPRCNLVSNIGFDGEATHTLTNSANYGGKQAFAILPLEHPAAIVVDKQRDAYCWAKRTSAGWLKDEVGYLYDSLLWSKGIGHRLLMGYKKRKGKGVNTKRI